MRYSVEVHNAGGYVPSGEREVPVQVPNPVWQPAVPEFRQFQCPMYTQSRNILTVSGRRTAISRGTAAVAKG
jgi:hypothetical protein